MKKKVWEIAVGSICVERPSMEYACMSGPIHVPSQQTTNLDFTIKPTCCTRPLIKWIAKKNEKEITMVVKDGLLEITLKGYITRVGFNYTIHTTEDIDIIQNIDWDNVENG